MAQGTGFSLRQKQFLDVAVGESYILKNFYLSGGTALASWYLHHRESYDLDFFSEREVNSSKISRWLVTRKTDIGYESSHFDEQLGFYFFHMQYPNGDQLKVDFSYFPSERIEKGPNWRGLDIDSLYDIAVNKAHTLRTSPRARDYIDFYFIIKNTGWVVRKIISDANIKFGITVGELETARHFLKVTELSEFPKMLVPFNQKSMEKFFLKLAQDLGKEIFK